MRDRSEGPVRAITYEAYEEMALAVMERTLIHAENAYFIPHVDVTGTVCRTNLPSNTAFRGFGGPQAIAGIESLVEDIAVVTGLDPREVRKRNCSGVNERNVTPYGQTIEVHTSIEHWAAKTFTHRHRVLRDGELMCEGTEVRAFVMKDPAHPDRIKAIPIPEDIQALCL